MLVCVQRSPGDAIVTSFSRQLLINCTTPPGFQVHRTPKENLVPGVVVVQTWVFVICVQCVPGYTKYPVLSSSHQAVLSIVLLKVREVNEDRWSVILAAGRVRSKKRNEKNM